MPVSINIYTHMHTHTNWHMHKGMHVYLTAALTRVIFFHRTLKLSLH